MEKNMELEEVIKEIEALIRLSKDKKFDIKIRDYEINLLEDVLNHLTKQEKEKNKELEEKLKEGDKMYKIKVFFKDGFRNTYEVDDWVEDDEELTLRKGSQIIINKRETTVISIIEERRK